MVNEIRTPLLLEVVQSALFTPGGSQALGSPRRAAACGAPRRRSCEKMCRSVHGVLSRAPGHWSALRSNKIQR